MTMIPPHKIGSAFFTASLHMGAYFFLSLQEGAVMAASSVQPDPEKDDKTLERLDQAMEHHMSEARKALGLRPPRG